MLHGRLYPTHGTSYLSSLNLSKLRDAPAHICNLAAGVRTKESIVAAREEFIKTLYTATSMQSTTAAAETFSKKISLWMKELQTYAKTCPGKNCRSRKTAALMIKHRAANLRERSHMTSAAEGEGVSKCRRLLTRGGGLSLVTSAKILKFWQKLFQIKRAYHYA